MLKIFETLFNNFCLFEFQIILTNSKMQVILFQDLVKRHDDDNLNLKTPIGPEPHPSWVYRHNYAALHSNRAAGSPVKRSISVLNAIKNGGGSKNSPSNNALPGIGAASTTSSTSTMDRVELLGGLHSKSPVTRKVSTPGKGPFINYIAPICPFFDPLPPPCVTFHNSSDNPPGKIT